MSWLRKQGARERSPAIGAGSREAAGEGLCFLVSSPRSGSTWTQRALNQHPRVFCTEQRLFGDFAERWIDDFETGAGHLRATLDAYVAALAVPYDHEALGLERERFRREATALLADALLEYGRRRSGKPVVVDKVTPYLGTSARVLASIRALYPRARLVYLLRDGRDVATSGVHDWLSKATPGRAPSPFQRLRRRRLVDGEPGAPLERFFEEAELETWARTWREPLEEIAPAAELTLRFEALKQDHAGELARLLRLLEVEADGELLARCVEASSFRRMSGGREPGQGVAGAKVRKGVVGDWRNAFTRADGERFHELAGELLLSHGYERDARWYERLPERLAI